MQRLTPSSGVVPLFNAIVRDAWAERETASSKSISAAQVRISELRQQLETLDEAFIFRKEVDRISYEPLRNRLREELASAKLALEDATLDDLDVEAAIASSDHVLRNSAVLWQNGNLEQRQKLQSAVFPVGISHDGEEF